MTVSRSHAAAKSIVCILYVHVSLLAVGNDAALCCSEFIGEVRHLDERWYLLVHLPGLHEHEKQSAAAKTKAGQRTVTQPGDMSTSESPLQTEPNCFLQDFIISHLLVTQYLNILNLLITKLVMHVEACRLENRCLDFI